MAKLTIKQEKFAQAYVRLGNASAAYREAYSAEKMSPDAINTEARRLAADPRITLRVNELTAPALKITGLTIERTLQEIARVAYQDPRKLFDDKGNLKAIPDLDDDAAASVASLEVTEEFEGRGEDRESVGFTKKIKLWDKNSALVTAARHLGLFEKDNKQRIPIQVDIELVG